MATRIRRNTAADVPIASLIQHDFNPGVLFAGSKQNGLLRFQPIASVIDACDQFHQRRIIRFSSHLDVIGLVQVRCRIGDPGSPCRVVAEQEQAFTGFVETANGTQPRQTRVCERGVHRVSTMFVGRANNQPAWLVEDHIRVHYCFDVDTVNRNNGAIHLGRKLRIALHAPVDLHSAFADPMFGLRPRANAHFGQHSRQTESR
jgi:hypothetical protein